MIGPSLYGTRFLDLFAGSGGIGIEALSRGAECAYFIDSSKEACDIIEGNLRFTRLEEKGHVIRSDVRGGIERLQSLSCQPFSFIFMDPPYGKGLQEDSLRLLSASALVNGETVIIFEASLEEDISFPESMGFQILKDKQYKTNRHVWLRKMDS